jgi:predicted negative regulator of RcsB-dependent stress response
MDFSKVVEQYWKPVAGLFVVIVVVGAGILFSNMRSKANEEKVQESYYVIEKKLLELKQRSAAPADPVKKEAPVDFTEVKKELEVFANANIGTIAAQMAALHLAELKIADSDQAGALALLQKVETKDKGLVNTLVEQQIAQLLSGQDKCQDAIAVLQKIIDRKEAAFVHNDAKLQQALCHVKLGNTKQAEEILTNLSSQSSQAEYGNSPATKEAEKYLRLLQFKKTSGT